MIMRTAFAFIFCAIGYNASAQNAAVIPTGAMRNTLFNGQLSALISMDSTAMPGTYGIGPLEHLHGELMLLDGHCYVSNVTSDGAMQVVERTDVGAPFFVQQHVVKWDVVELPDSVIDLRSLDDFLNASYAERKTAFAFKLVGTVEKVDVHLVNVPRGTVVNGPDDAHAHNKQYSLVDQEVEALGFFSTQHKAVFTHHDSNIHVHAITPDRSWMGHVEMMRFDPRTTQLWIGLP